MNPNTATAIDLSLPVADPHTNKAIGLENLMALRDALIVLKGPLGNIPALRTRIQNSVFNQAAQDHLLR